MISKAQNERIFEFSKDYSGWIGASTEIDKNSWRWSDGSTLDFTNWDDYKPIDTHGCGYIVNKVSEHIFFLKLMCFVS